MSKARHYQVMSVLYLIAAYVSQKESPIISLLFFILAIVYALVSMFFYTQLIGEKTK